MGAFDSFIQGVRSVGTVAVEQVQNYRTAQDAINGVNVPVNGFTPSTPSAPTSLFNPGDDGKFRMPVWAWGLLALSGAGLLVWIVKKVF